MNQKQNKSSDRTNLWDLIRSTLGRRSRKPKKEVLKLTDIGHERKRSVNDSSVAAKEALQDIFSGR